MEETTETVVVECNPIPLKEWIDGGTEEECRSCLMGPVVEWYRDILDERGMPELAREIEQVAETASPAELAQKLDDVKATVDEEVRNRLKDFDCAMQNYKPGEANEEAISGEQQ